MRRVTRFVDLVVSSILVLLPISVIGSYLNAEVSVEIVWLR